MLALLEDQPSTWRSNLDLFSGAVRTQFATRLFPSLALVLSLSGIVLGFAASYWVTPTYISRAVLQDRSRSRQELMNRKDVVTSAHALGQIVEDFGLYQHELGSTPRDVVLDRMRSHMRFAVAQHRAPDTSSEVLMIQFSSSNPHLARQVVERLARDMRADSEMEVLDAATSPQRPSYPSRPMFAATGLLAGFGIAVLTAIFRKISGGRFLRHA